jgi:uncharacterized protein with von Willebrand factor type A (vWA) domain
LLIDTSGSMQGAKLDAAKEAARVAIEVLAPADQVAIISFDSEAKVEIALQPAANKKQIAKDVAKLAAGGGTAFLPALQAAEKVLHGSKLVSKHVILLTDGESPSDGVAELVKTMHEAKITVTAVGLGGADRTILSTISEEGAGRLYMVEDIGALPRIFMKEIGEAFR